MVVFVLWNQDLGTVLIPKSGKCLYILVYFVVNHSTIITMILEIMHLKTVLPRFLLRNYAYQVKDISDIKQTAIAGAAQM